MTTSFPGKTWSLIWRPVLKGFVISFYILTLGVSNLNPLYPKISVHILHTVLKSFPKVLMRRICLTIRSFFGWPSFPLFPWHDVGFSGDFVRRNWMLATQRVYSKWIKICTQLYQKKKIVLKLKKTMTSKGRALKKRHFPSPLPIFITLLSLCVTRAHFNWVKLKSK